MTKPKKIMKSEKDTQNLVEVLDEMSLDQAMELLQGLKARFGGGAVIERETGWDWDDRCDRLYVHYQREETDDEYAARLKRSQAARVAAQRHKERLAVEQEEKDLREFERLRAKYEHASSKTSS
jgi:hypothetical protein